MIPVGPIILAVLAATRAASGEKVGPSGKGWFLLQWWFAPFFVLWGWMLVDAGHAPWGVALAALGVVLLVPWPLARAITIPLGWPRATWVLAVLADWTWGLDRGGGAYCAAVIAFRRRPTPQGAAFLVKREAKLVRPGGALPAALGLLALHHGDVDGARALFATERHYDPWKTPRLARCIAREWLAADMAARGAWNELAAFDGGRSRACFFLARCARRLVAAATPPAPPAEAPPATQGSSPSQSSSSQSSSSQSSSSQSSSSAATAAPSSATRTWRAPSDFMLRLAWLLAPARRVTRPLLDRALALPVDDARDAVDGEGVPADVRTQGDAVAVAVKRDDDRAPGARAAATAAALRLHVDALRTPPSYRTAASLVAVARAWEAALPRAPSLVDEGVVDGLVELIHDVDLRAAVVDDPPPLLARAVDRVRAERIEALEQASDALHRRAEAPIDLPPADELREIAALRAAYERAARAGPEAQRLAWEAVHAQACALAVHLWNVRKETRVANATFRWLLDEARRNDDADVVALQTKNVAVGA